MVYGNLTAKRWLKWRLNDLLGLRTEIIPRNERLCKPTYMVVAIVIRHEPNGAKLFVGAFDILGNNLTKRRFAFVGKVRGVML